MHRLSVFVLTIALACTGALVYWYSHESARINEEKTAQSAQAPAVYPYITVIPHHDMVKDMRRHFLKESYAGAESTITTVILLSPNHFNSGLQPVLTTDEGGVLGVPVDIEAFTFEHGVHSVIPDIRSVLPHARIIPVIVKRSASSESLDELVQGILRTCTTACTVVASVDFSHYQSSGIAYMHDILTETLLETKDSARLLTNAEVDSPEVLHSIARIAARKRLSWHTYSRTHSGELSHAPYSLDTTSHILGTYARQGDPAQTKRTHKETVVDAPFVSLLVGGDVMLDRGVARANPVTEYFTDFGRTFWGFHGVLVNHEGVVSDRDRVPAPPSQDDSFNGMKFIFPRTAPNALSLAGITTVSLANNHADNHTYLGPRAGLIYTKNALIVSHITPCGGYADTDIDDVSYVRGESLTLAVVCVNAFSHVPDLTEKITILKTMGYTVLMYPHWGVEYATEHSLAQERMARAWIDAGADIVIGSHPHVVQDVAVYKGHPIIYSLGNFVFDQHFSDEVSRGLLAGLLVTSDAVHITLVPVSQSRVPGEVYVPKRTDISARDTYTDRLSSWDEFLNTTDGVYTFTY